MPPDIKAMVVGLREAVMPEEETDATTPTVPTKLLRLVKVTTDVLSSPVTTLRLDEDEIVKSVTCTIT